MLSGDAVVVDVGANIGWYTLRAARRAKKVYAFEPEPTNYELLQKAVRANGFSNVELEKLIVGDTDGETDLFLSIDAGRHSTVRKSGRKITVKCTTLDSFLPTQTIDVLKVDVEGAESRVLAGADEGIKGGRIRNIIMELNPEFPMNRLQEYQKLYEARMVEGERNLVLKAKGP